MIVKIYAVFVFSICYTASLPVTIEVIKNRLKEDNIFDWTDDKLTEIERKEMRELFDFIEISISSRNRQPQNVQDKFATMNLVRKIVQTQLEEKRISSSLASKFRWENL